MEIREKKMEANMHDVCVCCVASCVLSDLGSFSPALS